jgi:hypothetical protein
MQNRSQQNHRATAEKWRFVTASPIVRKNALSLRDHNHMLRNVPFSVVEKTHHESHHTLVIISVRAAEYAVSQLSDIGCHVAARDSLEPRVESLSKLCDA